jgi:hypothetical protein
MLSSPSTLLSRPFSVEHDDFAPISKVVPQDDIKAQIAEVCSLPTHP